MKTNKNLWKGVTAILFAAMMVATVFAQVCPPGMVSYWKFDEGGGTIARDSVGANDGTIYGATWTTGIVESALSFDGLLNYVEVPYTPDLKLTGSWTAETWYKTIGANCPGEGGGVYPSCGVLFAQSQYWVQYTGIVLKVGDWSAESPGVGNLGIILYTGFGSIHPHYPGWEGYSVEVPTDGFWHHVAFTFENGNLKIYLDGDKAMEITTLGTTVRYSLNQPSWFGRMGSGTDSWNPYQGEIDEFAIYNRALTAEEIQQHYQKGLNGFGYCEVAVSLIATIDFDPDTLNLQSNGKWVTTYIELPESYDVNNIKVSTVMLNDQVQAEASPTEIGDYDNDDIADLMVKFNRSAVQEILEVGNEVEITVAGELTDGTPFEGSDTIRVIDKGKGK